MATNEQPHHRVYRTRLTWLMEYLQLDGVLSKLLSENIISKIAYEKLEREYDRNGQAATIEKLFAGYLMTDPDPASFNKLLDALRTLSKGYVANTLQDDYNKLISSNGDGQGNIGTIESQGEAEPAGLQTGATANPPTAEGALETGAGSGPLIDNEEEDTDGELKIDVTPVNVNDPTIQSLLKDKGVYPVHRKPRGKVVILNIQNFAGGRKRKGSQYDATNLENLFQHVHFDTVVYKDLKAQEIRDKIKEERKKIKPEDEAFILCALSHGGEKSGKHYIRGKDWKKVYVEEDLCEPFNGKNCSALLTKPKIFIIQACRGGKDTKGVEVTDDIPDTEEEDGCLMVHKDTDVLIARSTISKYVSYRDEDLGSRFIRTLVRVFAAQAHTKHIVDMLTEVRRKVNDGKTKLQVPEDTLRLEKSFYFFPGYPTEQ